jgi:hypothetical protein
MIVRPAALLAVTLRVPLTRSFPQLAKSPTCPLFLSHNRNQVEQRLPFGVTSTNIRTMSSSSSSFQQEPCYAGELLTPFPSRSDAEQNVMEETIRFSDGEGGSGSGTRAPSGSLACQHDR